MTPQTARKWSSGPIMVRAFPNDFMGKPDSSLGPPQIGFLRRILSSRVRRVGEVSPFRFDEILLKKPIFGGPSGETGKHTISLSFYRTIYIYKVVLLIHIYGHSKERSHV